MGTNLTKEEERKWSERGGRPKSGRERERGRTKPPPIPPRTVQGGSRVYIRTQDPTVDIALKMIHLPQEIWSAARFERERSKAAEEMARRGLHAQRDRAPPGQRKDGQFRLHPDVVPPLEGNDSGYPHPRQDGDSDSTQSEGVDRALRPPAEHNPDLQQESEEGTSDGPAEVSPDVGHVGGFGTPDPEVEEAVPYLPHSYANEDEDDEELREVLEQLEMAPMDPNREQGEPHPEPYPPPDLLETQVKSEQAFLLDAIRLPKFLATQHVYHGPGTFDVALDLVNMGITEIEPTEGMDYLYDPVTHPAQFDAINTLATTQLIINMFRRALRENGQLDRPEWKWGLAPITVFPYAFQIPQAYYEVGEAEDAPGTVRYGFFEQGGRFQFYCRSFDIIAHETGHALLDGIQPVMLTEGSTEGIALHEAFGDLTAVCGVLHQVDLCESILIESRGDLRRRNFLPIIADNLSAGNGIRSIDNDLKVSDVEEEPHALSLVITGAVYDVIVDAFERQATRNDLSTDAQTLSNIGVHVYGIVLLAYKEAPNVKIKIRDITRGMVTMEKDDDFRASMEDNFRRRELMDLNLKAKPKTRIDTNKAALCCDSLRRCYKGIGCVQVGPQGVPVGASSHLEMGATPMHRDTSRYIPPQPQYVPSHIPPQPQYVPSQPQYVSPQSKYVPTQPQFVPPLPQTYDEKPMFVTTVPVFR